jgi:hypothetical protein
MEKPPEVEDGQLAVPYFKDTAVFALAEEPDSVVVRFRCHTGEEYHLLMGVADLEGAAKYLFGCAQGIRQGTKGQSVN